jgi:nitrite reductase (cytochrome c-552)
MEGFKKFNQLPYFEARALVEHPITCIDCHNPKDMSLRISRPGLINGLKVLKASQGIQNYDVNKQATVSEMRSYVCAQCHVEYHFDTNKQLVFPWHKGLKVENMMDYYDEIAFRDWIHAESKAPLLKAQHPEFEMWNQGIHARSGVSCADCHMPYKREGAMKISDHWIRSPNLNINRACQSCHKWSEKELIGRVEEIQDRTFSLRHEAMEALMDLIDGIVAGMTAGKTDAELYNARYMQRRAQFLLDFVEAENSKGFHAPGEAARILGLSANYSRQGLLTLKDPSFQGAIYSVDNAGVTNPMKLNTKFEKRTIPQGIQFPPAPAPAPAPVAPK